MNIFSGSIKTFLGTFIVLMGVLAVILALVSGSVHRDLAFKNKREMLVEMVRLGSDELLKKLKESSQDLGLSLQTTREFRLAFQQRNKDKLVKLLNNQFHQYFVTADIIKLEQISALDSKLKVISESTEGSFFFSKNENNTCPELFTELKNRTGPQRFEILTLLCKTGNKPIHTVAVPVGGLRLKGYLIITTNPVHNLIPVGTKLGLPIKLSSLDNNLIYKSENWPEVENKSFIVPFNINNNNGEKLLSINVAHDIEELSDDLNKARTLFLIVAFAGTISIVTFSVWLIRKTMILPLRRLNNCLAEIHKSRSHIGDQLVISGAKEIRDLIRGFNLMSSELQNLYTAMENMAYTDSLTKLPNRLLFNERLEEITRIARGKNRFFSVFLFDLNRFKQINDTLGHHIGDQLLEQVSIRLSDTLRFGDIVSRINKEDISNINSDIVARLGGDEFSAVFQNTRNQDEAIIIAKKIQSAIEQPFHLDGNEVNIGVSIGIALSPAHGDNLQTLLKNADCAMYHAKKNNLGYFVYSPGMENTD